jgi:hypothetical protein
MLAFLRKHHMLKKNYIPNILQIEKYSVYLKTNSMKLTVTDINK